MSTTISPINQLRPISNLDTYVHTTLNNGPYTASIFVTEQPPSGMSILIKQNTSTVASFSSPAATQSIINLQVSMNITAGDTISFVLSSSNAQDQQPNDFKGLINIRQGLI